MQFGSAFSQTGCDPYLTRRAQLSKILKASQPTINITAKAHLIIAIFPRHRLSRLFLAEQIAPSRLPAKETIRLIIHRTTGPTNVPLLLACVGLWCA